MSNERKGAGPAPWELPEMPPKGSGAPRARRPGTSSPLVATILSARPCIVTYHWRDSQAVLCVGAANDCACCALRMGSKWTMWLVGQEVAGGPQVGIEVSQASAELFDGPHFRDASYNLRGWRIRLTRESARRRAPIRVELAQPKGNVEELPEPFDLRPWVARLYRMG